jgi:putative hydrolase of HD superfamily
MEVKKEHVDKVFDLAKLSLAFAKVNRVTHHEDGIRPESDTDHTFMLSLIACSLADTFYKDKLDIGLVSQFALIHDLVEVYAGDTNSFVNVSEESRKEKEERERKSLEKIKDQFGKDFPWIHTKIEEYESQNSKEARFVKFVDKILPELSHVLSGFSYINNSGLGKDYFLDFLDTKYHSLERKYGSDFPEILYLYNLELEKVKEDFNNLN